jgi:MFS family permease
MRGRIAVSLMFGCVGIVIGTWTARLPAVKQNLGLSDGLLSIALLGFAVGAIIGMQVVGRLIDRFTSRRVMLGAAVGDGVMLIVAALCPNLVVLVIAMLAFGTVHGVLNIAVNANAVEVERSVGRPVMSSFHAVYSIGGILGAGVGALFAAVGASVVVTFVTVAVFLVGLVATARPLALSAPVPPEAGDTAPFRLDRRLALFGVIAFCCLVGEGAAADWSSVYARDNLGATAGIAALAYAAFAAAMTAGRLFGDRLTTRFGPVALVRASALVAVVGLGSALVIDAAWAGIVGFACLGAGLSLIAPQVFSAVGRENAARAGQALARVVSIGWLGFVFGPLLIGAAASVVGLPAALAIPVALAAFVAATAGALRPRATVAHSSS